METGFTFFVDLFFADGGVATGSASLDGVFGFQTFGFDPTFSVGLTAVRWYTDGNQFALDNIAVNVPEPGTLALLGLGLFGMGLARRRRKV